MMHSRAAVVAALLLVSAVSLEPQTRDAARFDGEALATATFAGGCFWCMEPPFDKLDGVVSTTSGYTGGHTTNPTYAEVSAGVTGHAEAVEVLYDPMTVSYTQLLEVFWRNIDPLTPNRQFCDRGSQYRSAISITMPSRSAWPAGRSFSCRNQDSSTTRS